MQGHGVITKSGRQVRVPAGLQEQLMAVVMGRSELPVLLLAEA